MYVRNIFKINKHIPYCKTIFSNFPTQHNNKPCKSDYIEFFINSIKVVTFCSIIWGFESHKKYQLHHLDVNDRILSNYVNCLKRQNTKERCQREKKFLEYIFNPEY